MKKTILTIGLVLILVVTLLALAGCGAKEDKNSIVGSWEYSGGGYTYVFNSDKTGCYKVGSTEMNFTYEDDGSKVSILYTGNTMASDYEYKIEGKKLIIKDSFGSDVEYIKK